MFEFEIEIELQLVLKKYLNPNGNTSFSFTRNKSWGNNRTVYFELDATLHGSNTIYSFHNGANINGKWRSCMGWDFNLLYLLNIFSYCKNVW